MKIVMVAGCRQQIYLSISDTNKTTHKHKLIRVTDLEPLRIVKEEAGYVRFEFERQLGRSLRSMHLAAYFKDEGEGDDCNVVSGNFYSVQPYGVMDGIDFMYTGFPRRIEVEKIHDVLFHSNGVVLLSTLGTSLSGEIFNVNSEQLAANVASLLKASKLIYFTKQDIAFRNKTTKSLVKNLRVSDAKALLSYYHVNINQKEFATIGNTTSSTEQDCDKNSTATGDYKMVCLRFDGYYQLWRRVSNVHILLHQPMVHSYKSCIHVMDVEH